MQIYHFQRFFYIIDWYISPILYEKTSQFLDKLGYSVHSGWGERSDKVPNVRSKTLTVFNRLLQNAHIYLGIFLRFWQLKSKLHILNTQQVQVENFQSLFCVLFHSKLWEKILLDSTAV